MKIDILRWYWYVDHKANSRHVKEHKGLASKTEMISVLGLRFTFQYIRDEDDDESEQEIEARGFILPTLAHKIYTYTHHDSI